MKKLLFISSFLFCASICFAQFPITQGIGSKNTQVTTQGAFASDSGYVYRYNWPDTITLNRGFLKNIPGIVVRVNDTLRIRNNAATAWVNLGAASSINIYNSSGILTGNRTLSGGGSFDLLFNSLASFQVNDAIGTNRLQVSNVRTKLFAPLQTITFEVGDSARLVHSATSGSLTGYRLMARNTASGGLVDYTGLIGNQNLQQVTDNGSTTTSSATFGQSDSVGLVINYPWSNNPLNTWVDNTSTATVTTNGSNTTVDGGNLDMNNYFGYTIDMGVENWTARFSAIAADKDNSSKGIGLNLNTAIGSAMFANWFLADTSGYIAYSEANSLPDYNTSDNNRETSTFKWNAGDSLDFVFQRRSRAYYIAVTNRATGQTSFLKRYDRVYSTVGSLRLHFYGGEWRLFNNFTLTYDEPHEPQGAVAGNSIVYGGDAVNEARAWWNQATQGYTVVKMSGPGETSLQGWLRLADILRVHPRILFWNYGVNDLRGGGNIDSFCNRTIRVIVACNAASPAIDVILSTLVPQTTNAATFNDSIIAIGARYGKKVLPFYTTLKGSGVDMAAKFTIDGVHPNSYGHDMLAPFGKQVMDSAFTPFSPIKLDRIPQATYFKGELVLGDDNEVLNVIPGNNPYYLKMVGVPLTNTSIPQLGNAFMAGSLWLNSNLAELIVTNNGNPVTSPTFSVQDDGVTYPRSLDAGVGSFTVTTSLTQLNTDPFRFVNGAYLNPLNQTMEVRNQGLGSGVGFKISNVAATISSTYKTQQWMINEGSGEDEGAFIDRRGGYRGNDTTSGYTRRFPYAAFGAGDFYDKATTDSLIAAGGGGGGGLLFARTDARNNTAAAMLFSGADEELTIDSLSVFQLFSYADVDSYSLIQTISTENSIRYLHNGFDNFVSIGAGVAQIRAEDSIRIIQPAESATLGDNHFLMVTATGGVIEYTGSIGGAVEWNGITDPTGDQALTFGAGESSTWTNSNTTEDLFTVNTSTLTTSSLFSLNSTSTALASGNNLMELVMSGANGTAGITANPLRISVTNTGTTSNNTGISVTASGASTNIGISSTIASQSLTTVAGRFNGGVSILAGDATAPHIQLRNTSDGLDWRIGSFQYTGGGNNDVYFYNGQGVSGFSMILDYQSLNMAMMGGATAFTPTAVIDIAASTTVKASLRLRAGVAPTSPNDAEMWYEDTNDRLMFRQNATSIELIGASAVNSVSPTAPDRTITVSINGVTYYISAKTTND